MHDIEYRILQGIVASWRRAASIYRGGAAPVNKARAEAYEVCAAELETAFDLLEGE